MSQIIKKWKYEQRDEKRWLQLHSDKIVIFSFGTEQRMTFGNFLMSSSLFHQITPTVFSKVLAAMTRLPQPAGLDDWQQRSWLFWQSIDTQKIAQMDCPLDTYNEFFLDRNGAFIQSLEPRGQFIREFMPLHLFYFFCIGDSILPGNTRLAAWENIENAFVKNAELLKPHRCILFNYNKIPTKNWNIYEENRDAGIYLSVDKYISAGGFSGRDGGGSRETFEWFWYNHAHSTLNSSWQEKIPEILADLKNALY